MNLFSFRFGTQDLIVINEVIQKNEYGLPDSMLGETVIDLGANIGCFAIACLWRGAKFVECYEPEDQNYEILCKNMEPYKNLTRCVKAAAWRSDENSDKLRLCGMEDGKTAMHHCFGTGQETTTKGLDEIIARFPEVDLLKLDIEGSEYPVLYTSKTLATKVKRIVGELHSGFKYGKAPWDSTPEGVKQYLESLGFDVELKMNFGDPKYTLGFEAVNKNLVPEECAA